MYNSNYSPNLEARMASTSGEYPIKMNFPFYWSSEYQNGRWLEVTNVKHSILRSKLNAARNKLRGEYIQWRNKSYTRKHAAKLLGFSKNKRFFAFGAYLGPHNMLEAMIPLAKGEKKNGKVEYAVLLRNINQHTATYIRALAKAKGVPIAYVKDFLHLHEDIHFCKNEMSETGNYAMMEKVYLSLSARAERNESPNMAKIYKILADFARHQNENADTIYKSAQSGNLENIVKSIMSDFDISESEAYAVAKELVKEAKQEKKKASKDKPNKEKKGSKNRQKTKSGKKSNK